MSTPPLSAAAKFRVCATALLLVSVFVHARDLATPGLLDASGRIKGSDYMRLYVTGALAGAGRWKELYSADAHVREAQRRIDPGIRMSGLHPNYGPLTGVMLAPLARFPFLTSYALFCAASVALLLLAAAVLVRHTSNLRSQRGVVLVCAAASPALFESLRYGQLSAFSAMLFALAAAAHGTGRPVLAGVALSGLIFKPPLLVAPLAVLVLRRENRLVGGVLLGAIAQVLLVLPFAGAAAFGDWISVLAIQARTPEMVQGFPAEVHSVRGFLRLLGLSGVGLTAAFVASAAAIVAFTAYVWARFSDWRPRWIALTLAAILASPHLLTYDLLLLLVPIALAADLLLDGVRAPWWVMPVLPALYFASLVSPLLARWTHVQYSTLAMAVLLLWCGQALDGRPRPFPAAPASIRTPPAPG